MATLTVQVSDLDGLEYTTVAAAAGGDVFDNDGMTIFIVEDTGDGVTVTIDSIRACNQGFDHDGGGVQTSATTAIYGPFDKGRFNDASGQIAVTYDSETSVAVAAVSV